MDESKERGTGTAAESPNGSKDGSRREDNLELLRQAAAESARAEPRDRSRVIVPASEVRRERVPGWLLPALLVVLVALTVANLSGFSPIGGLPPEPSESEIAESVARATETEAEWVESYVQAFGELPVDGESFDLEGLGSLVPSSDGSFQLILRDQDGWSGVYDSKDATVSVSAPQ